ncbi:MAG: hypothetical protein Q9164_002815 [Protoblastenia rupestris]
MTELTFAKQFLSTLDARPMKLQPDHVSNPKTLEIHAPYTLPRMPEPMKKPSTTSSASQTTPASITITLKSSRNPQMELKLPDMDAGTTSVLELKERIATEVGMDGIEKIKVLWERKPVSDAKIVKEVIGEEGLQKAEVEFGVMVMGYVAPAAASKADVPKETAGDKMEVDGERETAAAEGAIGEEALGREEFWDDLKGFLQQRLKDESLAEDALGVFRNAWRRR